jgi:Secretion system C-terminal sorting domain
MKKSEIVLISSLTVIAFVLMSWGYIGHQNISSKIILSFNDEMGGFESWVSYMTSHASDADNRKNEDPDESHRHYIDIDNYDEFVDDGRIAQTWNSVVDIHGQSFVDNNGILPWTTLITYDSLRNCMSRRDYEKAKFFAADLGHYVADGHMPLHITANYDGQLTGNNGIHYRFESAMINDHINEVVFTGKEAEYINNVPDYIFNYLYQNYKYVDTIMAADNYAKTISSSYNTAYYNAMWDKSQSFIHSIMSNASVAITELLYTAWVDAGKPSLFPAAVEESKSAEITDLYPNPFSESVSFNIKVKDASNINIRIHDVSGKLVEIIKDHQFYSPGNYQLAWIAGENSSGLYYLVIDNGINSSVRSVVLSR